MEGNLPNSTNALNLRDLLALLNPILPNDKGIVMYCCAFAERLANQLIETFPQLSVVGVCKISGELRPD